MDEKDYRFFSEEVLKDLGGRNDDTALLVLGENHYYGAYGIVDLDAAFECFSKAYRIGNPKAGPLLAEMMYFHQVEIDGFDTDEDYHAEAYRLYKEASDLDILAGRRGLCKMLIVGDYLEKDEDAALSMLAGLKDSDYESSYLYDLLKSGDYSLEDIVPNNELYASCEEDELFDDPDR